MKKRSSMRPDNLREAAQRIRAAQNQLWSANLDDHPNYRNLRHRLSSALAITEAAFMEARRRAERTKGLYVGPAYRGGVVKGNQPTTGTAGALAAAALVAASVILRSLNY